MQAERISHLDDEFLATLSHELRSPRAAVLGTRRLVELYGGTVRAASPGVGCGATFILDLPGGREPRAGSEPSGEALRQDTGHGGSQT